jgi:hypothetical protein
VRLVDLAIEGDRLAEQGQGLVEAPLSAPQEGLELEQEGLVERIEPALVEVALGDRERLLGALEVEEHPQGVAQVGPGARLGGLDRARPVAPAVEVLRDLDGLGRRSRSGGSGLGGSGAGL